MVVENTTIKPWKKRWSNFYILVMEKASLRRMENLEFMKDETDMNLEFYKQKIG